MSLLILLKWAHVLSVIGLFGGLLVFQTGVPAATRQSPELSRGILRVLNILLGLGLLAGLAMVGIVHRSYVGTPAAGHFFGIVGMKLLFLVVIGGLLPMSARRPNGDALRWISIVLLAVAALAGMTI